MVPALVRAFIFVAACPAFSAGSHFYTTIFFWLPAEELRESSLRRITFIRKPFWSFFHVVLNETSAGLSGHSCTIVTSLSWCESYRNIAQPNVTFHPNNSRPLFAASPGRSNNCNLLLRLPLIAISFLLPPLFPMAQSGNVSVIQKQFDKYNEQSLQEKIFVHTDRSFYVAGEIIWFKVYCVNEDNNTLLNLSKVVYVEVLDKDQQPVLQAKIALQDGTGSGSLLLPADIHSGNYLFRAYTNWMKNFDPGFYYHQQLTIVNTIVADTVPLQKQVDNYEVQFFPEGGDMVNELKSKIAFRVTDNFGKGIDFIGVITDEKKDTVVRFRPAGFGIGNFSFTPHRNKHYKAFITTVNGKQIMQNLLPAIDSGFVINVSGIDKEEKLKINIQTNTGSNAAYLFIHSRQQVKLEQPLHFTNGAATIEIDKSIVSEGISHITLFDHNHQPVCERLYFKRPTQKLSIDAKTNTKEYSLRKQVNLNLVTKDEINNAGPANLSMAVFLIDSLTRNYKDIYSYLWMTSELKGQVESPEYYFRSNEAQVNEALDNLLLTHGWRRFKWSDILNNKKPVLQFIPEYDGHIVSGTIVNRGNEKVAPRISAFLSVPGTHFKLYNSISDSSGTINFNMKDFYGTRLMVAMLNSNDTTYRVDLSNPFSENYSSERIYPFGSAAIETSGLLKRSINMQVQNIYAGTNLHVFENAKTDTPHFYGKADVIYKLDNYTRFPTMEEVLTEYVPQINIRKRQDKFSLTMINTNAKAVVSILNPVILLDGVPQFDFGNKISHYDPLKVDRLEIINSPYFLGSARLDGIASFFSYKGNLEGFNLDSSATVLDYEALQLRREFYTPTYETNEKLTSPLPDFRNLLYWSPDINTNEKGEKEINFYTSDQPGKYAVIVQGFSQSGRTGSAMFTIDVKKDDSVSK